MIRQPHYFIKKASLYCSCCAQGGRTHGYEPVYEQAKEGVTCIICMQPLNNEDKSGLERLVRLVALV